MNGCQKELTGNIQTKRDKYVINVNFYNKNGERKPKQIPTGLSVKGYNKRLVEDLKDFALHMVNDENANLEYVKTVVKKQAKIGSVPDVAKQASSQPITEEPTVRRNNIPDATYTVPAVLGGVEARIDEYENPFIVPVEIRKIVALTPKPKIYGNSDFIGDKMPLVTYFKNWITGQKHEVNHNTYAAYEMQMSMRIIPFFCFFDLMLSDLSHHHVKMFYDYILEAPRLDGKTGKVSATTVHRVHSVLHKAINQAFKDELIVANPVSKVHPPREKVFHPQYYSASQITLFLQSIIGDIAEIPLALSFFFGTRRSETLGLKESAIDFDAKVIYIKHTVTIGQRKHDFVKMDAQGLVKQDRTKTKKSCRTLPVPDAFMAYLKKLVDRNAALRVAFGPTWNPDGYLCVHPDGRMIHPNVVTKHYKIVAKKAGLPINRLHDARHSIASLMIQNGTDIRILQDYLGHSSIQTTTRYSHLQSKHLVTPATKVQELIAFDGLSG